MSKLYSPLTFKSIFQERIWGGRKLADLFGKTLPPDKRIGESWEVVDRPEAQSIVRSGPLAGRSLHDLWVNCREQVFGEVADAPRFPLLIKLLDCREKLSLQVHPPPEVADALGGEAKTECWFIADAAPEAELYIGLQKPTKADQFKSAVEGGTAAELVSRIPVRKGDAFFIPSGRMHAIGGGTVIVEVQQNSDTTYRIFDWNRLDEKGQPRQLHVDQAMRCIDFNDVAVRPIEPRGESLLQHEIFELQRWHLDSARDIAPLGQFAIVLCLTGALRCADADFPPGEFFLVPASLENRSVHSRGEGTSLLRVTIPM